MKYLADTLRIHNENENYSDYSCGCCSGSRNYISFRALHSDSVPCKSLVRNNKNMGRSPSWVVGLLSNGSCMGSQSSSLVLICILCVRRCFLVSDLFCFILCCTQISQDETIKTLYSTTSWVGFFYQILIHPAILPNVF